MLPLLFTETVVHFSIMFWTDWGSSPRIERATMHGENRRTIVSTNLRWPNGITVDASLSRIYWTDASKDVIEFANFDGSGRTVSCRFVILELFYWCLAHKKVIKT